MDVMSSKEVGLFRRAARQAYIGLQGIPFDLHTAKWRGILDRALNFTLGTRGDERFFLAAGARTPLAHWQAPAVNRWRNAAIRGRELLEDRGQIKCFQFLGLKERVTIIRNAPETLALDILAALHPADTVRILAELHPEEVVNFFSNRAKSLDLGKLIWHFIDQREPGWLVALFEHPDMDPEKLIILGQYNEAAHSTPLGHQELAALFDHSDWSAQSIAKIADGMNAPGEFASDNQNYLTSVLVKMGNRAKAENINYYMRTQLIGVYSTKRAC